ncbi:MAG: RagB/SusD family nutrient uptake outer membrane protein [Bacteroidaceae bacterium]|nr:RagB/SusD family nutrient uptake outer membrane protein [Bacteroidaceae bacterium]
MNYKHLLPLLCMAFLTACDDYLDTLPDNRAELDTEQSIANMLVYAYPSTDFLLLTEFMSDNVDDYGENNPNADRFIEQVYRWDDVTESDNESPERIWASSYYAIAQANHVLQAIDKMAAAGPLSPLMLSVKGEALLCRAYNHFVLVNIFCKNYNRQTSTVDPGIPYVTEPETYVGKTYERGTVAETYRLIREDIEQGLPLVDDARLDVPKYHFNLAAAQAFAARFYLFAEEWEEAVHYADLCLGVQPKPMLRDWAHVATLTQQASAITQHYISAQLNCNLLLMTGYSKMGLAFGPYSVYSRYAHGAYLATNEDGNAVNIWGASTTADRRSVYYSGMKVYTATNLDKTLFWKLPYLFEYTDAVAGIGYYHTVYPAFTADECLLNRAEARVMLHQYDAAAADLDLWMNNILDTSVVHLTLSPDTIQRFYNSVRYSYTPTDMDPQGLRSTIKKHLHPSFSIDAEGSVQETMLQCVLGFRRIETLQMGLRWFDIKRYGIEVKRRVINASGIPERQTDVLLQNDPRRAVQIPLKVRQAGMTPNERD